MVYGGGLVCSSYINIDQSAVSYGLAAIFIWVFLVSNAVFQISSLFTCFFYNGGFGWAAKINFAGLVSGLGLVYSELFYRSLCFYTFHLFSFEIHQLFLVIRWANVYPSFPGSERKYLNYKYLNCVGLGYIPLTIQVSILCTLLGQKDNVKLTSTLMTQPIILFVGKVTHSAHTHTGLLP